MQQEASTVAATGPVLVLLPDSAAPLQASPDARGGEPTVLGLGLARRTVMAAARVGYRRIYFLARDGIYRLLLKQRGHISTIEYFDDRIYYA